MASGRTGTECSGASTPDTGAVDTAARQIAIGLPRSTNEEQKHRKQSLSARGITAMVRLARSDPAMRVSYDRLDANAYELNTSTGIVHLRTGDLGDHRWPRKILSPAAKRRAVDILKDTLSMSERLACKAVGLARSTYRRLPVAQTPADPDAEMRAWLRAYARKHPCHGFRRAWAALRYDERREVNKKKIHRLWREQGLQVKVTSARKRAGVSSIPAIQADAANVVWAIDCQFDSTTDGKAIKIASMIDEHTRCSLQNIVERSITAERLVAELEAAFAAAGGPPKVLRMDNGPEMVSQALQRFCENKTGMVYIPPGCPWDNGYIESFNNRLRKECLNRNHWNSLFEARVVIGDFKYEHNHRHRHSALGYRTPAEYAAACSHTHTPVACTIN